MILLMVSSGIEHVLCSAPTREDAKRCAFKWLRGDPDQYIVTPLTEEGDRIHLDLTLAT